MKKVVAVLGAVALTLLITTGAFAANKMLTGADIKNGSIGIVDLSKSAKAALKGQPGEKGATGEKGETGAKGDAGATGALRTRTPRTRRSVSESCTKGEPITASGRRLQFIPNRRSRLLGCLKLVVKS